MEETKAFRFTHLECSLIKDGLRMRAKALEAILNSPNYDREGVQEAIDIINNLIESLTEFEKDMPNEDIQTRIKYYLMLGLTQRVKEELQG